MWHRLRGRRASGPMLAAALTLAAGSSAVAGPGDPTGVDLATSDAEVTYRIPAMTTTPEGTVIVAFDRRNGTSGDLPADIDTLVRRSTDSGATWGPPRVAIDYPAPQGCGDPSLITDRETGAVHLFCTYSHGQVGFADSEPGSADPDDPRTLHVRQLTSTDDGRTWSEPRDLNEWIKDPAWPGVFASSGHGVQTADGRLLQPIVVRDPSGQHHSANIYSDDHGRTWHSGALLDPGTDESKAVELPDGRIVQNSRDIRGGRRLLSTSTDGGRTFGPAEEIAGLPDPGVNADEILVRPPEGGPRLLFSNPASRTERVDLTVRASCDGGRSWSGGTVLHPGPAGYSTMAQLPDGRLGVLAERGPVGPGGTITFTAMPMADAGNCSAAPLE